MEGPMGGKTIYGGKAVIVRRIDRVYFNTMGDVVKLQFKKAPGLPMIGS